MKKLLFITASLLFLTNGVLAQQFQSKQFAPGAAADNLGLSGFTPSGSTTNFLTLGGSLTSGHCLQADSSGNAVDAGSACGAGGGGSGTVSAGTTNNLGFYSTSGTTIAPLTTGTGIITALGNNTNGANGFPVLDGSGKLGASNLTTLSGDATNSGAAITVSKIGGKSVTLGGSLTVTGAYTLGLTLTGNTSLTFPTSGTVTALGNTTTGSGSIVLSSSPTLTTPNLGTPSAINLANATNLPIGSLSGTGSGVTTALGSGVNNANGFLTYNASGVLPLAGSLLVPNNYFISYKDTSNATTNVMILDNFNNLKLYNPVGQTYINPDFNQTLSLNYNNINPVWVGDGTHSTDFYVALGNVGIGNTSPGARLDVSGNAIISGTLTVNGIYNSNVGAVGYAFHDSSQGLNETLWDLETDNKQFNLRALNDTYSAGSNAMSVSRSGYAITGVDFPNGPITGKFVIQPNSGLSQSVVYRGSQHVMATDYMSNSAATTTGSMTISSNVLSLASAQDFVNGQGITVFGAGPAYSVAQVSGASGVQQGTTGSTTYAFKVSTFDYAGGIGVPVTITVNNGNASLSTANNLYLSFSKPGPAGGVLVWVSINGGGYTYIGYSNNNNFMWTGYVPNWRPVWVPSTPPGSAQPDWLVTTISSGAQTYVNAGNGTTTLTLAAAASTAVSGVRVQHDETAAFSNFNTLFASTGVTVDVPCGNYNLTSQVTITNPFISFVGQGLCSKINPYGASSDFAFIGPSLSAFNLGNGFSNFYMPSYNKAGGNPVLAQWVQTFTYNNVFIDHPAAGPAFYDVNDVRIEHMREVYPFGYANRGLSIWSGSSGSDYACCFMLIDDYVNALGTDPGANGGRLGGIGFAIDGNVATVISYNSAVSNIEGKGLAVYNDTGNAGSPQFIEFTDFGSEFSGDIGIYLADSAADLHFLNVQLHGTKNGNPNVIVTSTAHNFSFVGGRNINAGGSGFYISGHTGQITGMTIANNSAPNSGGTNQSAYGIELLGSAYGITGTGNYIGLDYGVGWQQRNPIRVASGAGHYAFTGNVFQGNQFDYEKNEGSYSLENVFSGNSGEGPPPTIASGFGSSPFVGSGATFKSFRINVGSGSPGSGTLTMPNAANGWNCHAEDLNSPQLRVAIGTTATSITLSAYSGASSTNFNSGDTLSVTCAY